MRCMMTERDVGRVVLELIADGLVRAGCPVRTRYGRGELGYVGPLGQYAIVSCRPYDAAADTWRVQVRCESIDLGGGKWLLPPGVERPRCRRDAAGCVWCATDNYRLEFSFAAAEAEQVGDWIPGYIVAMERGRDPEPYPDLHARWPWPPSRGTGYLWTRLGEGRQAARYARLRQAHQG